MEVSEEYRVRRVWTIETRSTRTAARTFAGLLVEHIAAKGKPEG